MQLNDIQHRFKTMVFGAADSVGGDAALSGLFESGGIEVPERLHVYRNSVLEKLSKVLAITFPTVAALTGETFFNQAARLYARQNPPAEGCLNLYGETFPAFLGAMKETAGLPYLHDVALYDWLFNAAYYAADDTALDRAALQALSPDAFAEVSLTLRHSAGLIRSPYPLTLIREFAAKEQHEEGETLDINAGGEALLVLRPGEKGMAVALEEGEYIMLESLRAGGTIRMALEKTLKNDAPFDLQAFLVKHFDLETFSGYQTNS